MGVVVRYKIRWRIMETCRVYDIRVIGENLRRLRLSAGYSVRDIRDYLGLVSVQSIYKFEKGLCMPQAEHLLALMELYDVDAHQLVSVDGTGDSVSQFGIELVNQRSACNSVLLLEHYAKRIGISLKTA